MQKPVITGVILIIQRAGYINSPFLKFIQIR